MGGAIGDYHERSAERLGTMMSNYDERLIGGAISDYRERLIGGAIGDYHTNNSQ